MKLTLAAALPLLFAPLAGWPLDPAANGDRPPAITAEERDTLLKNASELREQARRVKTDADARRTAADTECFREILVSACLERARSDHARSMREIRQFEADAARIERDVRNRQRIDRGAAAERRRVEAEAEASDNRQARDLELRALDEKQAAHDRRLAEAEQRAAREQAERQARDAEKARKRQADEEKAARRAEKARLKAAEREARAARKAAAKEHKK